MSVSLLLFQFLKLILDLCFLFCCPFFSLHSFTQCQQCFHYVRLHIVERQSSVYHNRSFVCIRGCCIEIASGKWCVMNGIPKINVINEYSICFFFFGLLQHYRCTRIKRLHRCWLSPGLVPSFYHIHFWLWNGIFVLHKSQGR